MKTIQLASRPTGSLGGLIARFAATEASGSGVGRTGPLLMASATLSVRPILAKITHRFLADRVVALRHYLIGFATPIAVFICFEMKSEPAKFSEILTTLNMLGFRFISSWTGAICSKRFRILTTAVLHKRLKSVSLWLEP